MDETTETPKDRGELTKEGVCIFVVSLCGAAAFAAAAAWIAMTQLGDFAHMLSHMEPLSHADEHIVGGEYNAVDALLYQRLIGLTLAAIVIWGGLGGYAAKRISVLTKQVRAAREP